ncbi:SDR family oxidoreductase [Schleiferia thermophila]|uniref:SDR family oxidoreductase n=1 Tax=Schleiferia thermophila TaxID=884107 RepID=UPI003EEC4283
MKILVTGCNGLLGNKLTERLKNHPYHQLINTSRGIDRYIRPGGYIYENLDITNKHEVEKVISKYKPEIIIHTAAMTNVDACEQDPEGCRRLNVDAVQYLTDECRAYDIHLVHISTDFIFDGTNGLLSEEAIPNPLSIYGKSKLDSEQIVISSGISASILRTILVYGYAPGLSRTNIVLWAKGALEKGQPIKVVNDQFRTPTLAEDLAEACLLAAEKKAKGIFHISGIDYMSIVEIVYAVADFWSLDASIVTPVDSVTLGQPANRPPRTGFIIEKARKVLGYNPHTFREGLAIVDRCLKIA